MLPIPVPIRKPLAERRVAELILRCVFCCITPEERRELMEGYVNLSAANRHKFEELTNLENLGNKMRDYYLFESGFDQPEE